MNTLPFLAIIDDQNISYLSYQRNKILKKNKILQIIKKLLNEKLLFIFRAFYYLSFFFFYINKNINKKFYYEHFFYKYIISIENIFFNNYISLKKIFNQKEYYSYDLHKVLRKITRLKKI
jgi:hypothetical protein